MKITMRQTTHDKSNSEYTYEFKLTKTPHCHQYNFLRFSKDETM